MTKPKFTPDPAPNIDGMPVEQQIRMILDHMQRQFNREEDWWPKDLEARVNALEGLIPYKTGTWPIIDYSSVTFNSEVDIPYVLSCGAGTSFNTGETNGSDAVLSNISGHGDRLVVSKSGSGSNYGVVGTYDISTDTWTKRAENPAPGAGGVRTGVYHFSGSGYGSVEQGTHAYYMLETRNGIGSATTNLYCKLISDWSDDPAISSLYGSIGIDTQFYDESPNYIAVGFQTSTTIAIRDKSSFGVVNYIYPPAGYALGACFWDAASTSWLCVVNQGASPYAAGVIVVAADSVGDIGGDVSPSAPTKLLTATGYAMNLVRNHWKDGDGNKYVIFTSASYAASLAPQPTYDGFVQKIDSDGDSIKAYSSDDTAGLDPSTFVEKGFSGQSSMSYNASTNRSLGSLNGVILQHNLDTDTWSTCTVSGVASGTIGAALDENDFLWGVDKDANPITLWKHEIY